VNFLGDGLFFEGGDLPTFSQAESSPQCKKPQTLRNVA